MSRSQAKSFHVSANFTNKSTANGF